MAIVRFETCTVTEGKVVPYVGCHPSGQKYDGTPVLVKTAFLGSDVPSRPMVRVVTLTDPARREVFGYAEDYADEIAPDPKLRDKHAPLSEASGTVSAGGTCSCGNPKCTGPHSFYHDDGTSATHPGIL